MFKSRFSQLFQGLIVSCQSEDSEAFYDRRFTLGMVQAALLGGTVGLRLDSPRTISAARALTDVPIIGIWKQHFPDSEVYITPTLQAAQAVLKAGADIVALDATDRLRPQGQQLTNMVATLKPQACLMADISTLKEGQQAQQMGFDCVGTTLAGYTSYSRQGREPDFQLLQELVKNLTIPVIMEGRIWTPEQAQQALRLGAYAVVVGSAITRPQLIAKQFIQKMSE